MTLKIPCLISTLLVILCSTQANTQVLHEYQRLAPDAIAEYDSFGFAIASNDDYIAISGPGVDRDDGGFGVVYIFDAITGDQIHTIEPVDAQQEENFGRTLSISDNQIAVGTMVFQGSDRVLNSVSIYDLQTGKQLIKIPLDGFQQRDFTRSMIALSGDILAIGSPFDSDVGDYSGAAYLYDANTGEQLQKLYPSDPAIFGYFGLVLTIHGDALAILSPNGRGHDRSSVVYLFDITTGDEMSIVPPSSEAHSRNTAQAIAMNDQYIAMSSLYDRKVWLFDRATGMQTAELETQDGQDGSDDVNLDVFGYSIAIDEDLLLVSAPVDAQNGSSAGAAYVFDLLTHSQVAKLLPRDGTRNQQFGHPLILSNSKAIVAETFNDDFGRRSGAVYQFDTTSIHRCSPDFDDNGLLNTTDIQLFIKQYTSNDPSADFDVDGLFNFYDISEFIHEFTTGCP